MADDQADLAVADLTVTSSRLELIDFSVPILEANFVIYAKRLAGYSSRVSMFSFLDPLSAVTWMGIAASMICVMVFLMIVHLLTRMKKERGILQFLWLSLLTLCGLHEIELLSKFRSVKILQLTWSLFVFLMISCYSANLAASLTIQKMDNNKAQSNCNYFGILPL